MNKVVIFAALLECTLTVRPILKSCQVCCETDGVTACRFIKDCVIGTESEEPKDPKQDPANNSDDT